MLLHIFPVVPFKPSGTFATKSTSTMTTKRSHKPTSTQPRLFKTKLEDALISGQDEDVAYIGVPKEFDDTFALDCADSLALQKLCDLQYYCPWRHCPSTTPLRGVATGSEEFVQSVQATTSGWAVARLGLPGAKVRRAT